MKEAFTCTMCGQCCRGSGGIVATIEDQKAMALFLHLDLLDFQARYVGSSGHKSFIRAGQDGLCLFFISGQGCMVHPVKPGPCRAWPFFRGNLLDESSFEMARQYCSGISQDISFADFVRQGLDYLDQQGLSAENQTSPANALNLTGIKKH
ncbi:YkgJ family cysteine cluster protein [Desulfonatronovibrio hydrogenovorans]|uniref:YkgJ family cysteine cluster protein n=1 Tax=Desulfonatronovibrio hydrogenovorans TaxID=53245 RepID=UPI00048FEA15|nr:YkgJ family cysteine cluster protein [Desulfonatronovibrio hydrogenovorans]